MQCFQWTKFLVLWIFLDNNSWCRKTWFGSLDICSVMWKQQVFSAISIESKFIKCTVCEFKSRSRQRIFRCPLQCQINMKLAFHISEDCSEIDYLLDLSLVMKTFESDRYLIKVPMTPKFLLHDVKEYLKLQYKFFYTFALQRFVDEIFQFLNFLFCRLITSQFA